MDHLEFYTSSTIFHSYQKDGDEAVCHGAPFTVEKRLLQRDSNLTLAKQARA